jgi:hypothetical protein
MFLSLGSFVEHASAGQAQTQLIDHTTLHSTLLLLTLAIVSFLLRHCLSEELKIIEREGRDTEMDDTGGITPNPQFGGEGIENMG